MHTALVGTDFNKVSLDLLEKVYFDEQSIESFLLTLPKTTPIRDIVILATCNRMELYYTCQNYELAKVWLIDHLSHFFGIDRSVLEPVLYHKRCLDTVLHLYEVSSGMKSMIFGENEILAQVKKAYSMCQKYRPLNSHMNKLFQSAIHVGKRVRDVLAINKGAYSISSIAVDAMTEVYDDLYTDKTIDCFQAVRGTEFNLNTLDDNIIKVKVPAGTQPDSVLHLKSKGMPVHETLSIRGNMYIKIHINIPKLNQEQLNKIKDL